jgi:hypothetical protein
MALACAYLDECFPGEGWDEVGHEYLTVAAASAAAAPNLDTALFGGYAGLGLAALALSQKGARYKRFLREVDQALIPRIAGEAERSALNQC